MGALFYLIRRSIINFIKNLKKQPSKLIPFVFIIGMVVFMLATMSKDKNIFDKNIPPQYIEVLLFACLPNYYTFKNHLFVS